MGEDACPRAAESGLHLAAKEILRTLNGRIFIPEETMRKENWPASEDSTGVRSEIRIKLDEQMTHIVPERQLSGSSVRIEPTDWKDYGFQPDAVFENDKGKLLVEIRVTHGVDEEKGCVSCVAHHSSSQAFAKVEAISASRSNGEAPIFICCSFCRGGPVFF